MRRSGPRSQAAPTRRPRCTKCSPTPAGSARTAARWRARWVATIRSPSGSRRSTPPASNSSCCSSSHWRPNSTASPHTSFRDSAAPVDISGESMTLVDDAVAVPVATRLDALIPIVAELRAADAAAERDRVLQYDALTALRGTGVLSLRVPGRYGGPGGSVRDVLTAVIRIAEASSNVAQALRPHFGFAERLLSNRATEAERQQWFPRLAAGLLVGNAVTDTRGRTPGSADTTLLAGEDGVLRLNGHKFYSTGTLYADAIAVSAVDAAGNDLQVIIPTDRDGVELFD